MYYMQVYFFILVFCSLLNILTFIKLLTKQNKIKQTNKTKEQKIFGILKGISVDDYFEGMAEEGEWAKCLWFVRRYQVSGGKKETGGRNIKWIFLIFLIFHVFFFFFFFFLICF